jgi:hypothetical protein
VTQLQVSRSRSRSDDLHRTLNGDGPHSGLKNDDLNQVEPDYWKRFDDQANQSCETSHDSRAYMSHP